MKRLLLPLLAALALPTAVNAEVANYYLLGMAKDKSYVVPMSTLELCEAAGKKFGSHKNEWSWDLLNVRPLAYLCVKAK